MNYWDEFHSGRLKDETLFYYKPKFDQIAEFVKSVEWVVEKPKLEVGCGSGLYAYLLNEMFPGWSDDYLGIDSSEKSVEIANKYFKLDIRQADIYDFRVDKKFDLFVFWDVLEHIEHHDKLSESMVALGSEDFSIIGNIPLYLSTHGGFERPMDIDVVKRFGRMCGLNKIKDRIYGYSHHPYMTFHLVK